MAQNRFMIYIKKWSAEMGHLVATNNGIVTANLFIDWDSARRIQRPKWRAADDNNISFKDHVSYVLQCFYELQKRIAEKLLAVAPGQRILIEKSRLYHGWHSGSTKTRERQIWEDVAPQLKNYINKNVSFSPDIEYGNVLINCGRRMPLLDTVRFRDGVQEQKMVDTSLVADLLSYCRAASKNFRPGQKPQTMAIIIGDDDDLLPGAFMAEQWGLPTYVFRVTRADENKFIDTNGIAFGLQG